MKAEAWHNYITKLRAIDKKAYDKISEWVLEHNISMYADEYEYNKALLDYAYAIATKYGEASSALACQMYEETAELEGVTIPPAMPAPTATYTETAIAVNGAKMQGEGNVPGAVERLVKLAGQDTTMLNARRDGAEWAWIPSGDTCSFCITLASRGWQRQSKRAASSHAQHIHANCDCAYAVRFNSTDEVAGYDPDKYYEQYVNAGDTPRERINALRRENYAKNKDYINAQKRAAYARRIELEEQ